MCVDDNSTLAMNSPSPLVTLRNRPRRISEGTARPPVARRAGRYEFARGRPARRISGVTDVTAHPRLPGPLPEGSRTTRARDAAVAEAEKGPRGTLTGAAHQHRPAPINPAVTALTAPRRKARSPRRPGGTGLTGRHRHMSLDNVAGSSGENRLPRRRREVGVPRRHRSGSTCTASQNRLISDTIPPAAPVPWTARVPRRADPKPEGSSGMGQILRVSRP